MDIGGGARGSDCRLSVSARGCSDAPPPLFEQVCARSTALQPGMRHWLKNRKLTERNARKWIEIQRTRRYDQRTAVCVFLALRLTKRLAARKRSRGYPGGTIAPSLSERADP